MKSARLLLSLIALPFLCLTSYAQDVTYSGYFMRGASYTHILNPAFSPDYSYINVPVIGDLAVGYSGNLNPGSFIYPSSGGKYKIESFLSPAVDVSSFLSSVPQTGRVSAGARCGVLSFGALSDDNFWTFDINARATVEAEVPREALSFMKSGISDRINSLYEFSDLYFTDNAYAEASVGFSRKVNEKFRLGVNVKFLVGLHSHSAHIERMNVSPSSGEWLIDSRASVENCGPFAISGGRISTVPGTFTGFGLATDLGVSYMPVEGLVLSLSLLDFGGIRWGAKSIARQSGEGTHSFNASDGITLDGNDFITKQMRDLRTDLTNMLSLSDDPVDGGDMKRLNPTVNFSAEYFLPDNRISFGALYSGTFYQTYYSNKLMGSVNLRPWPTLELSMSYSFLDYGAKSFGAAINLFDLIFVSWDHIFFHTLPYFIPANCTTSTLQVGLTIPLMP